MDNRYVTAAEFKANCLRLMDEVARQRRTAKICGDVISPIEDAGWTGNGENI